MVKGAWTELRERGGKRLLTAADTASLVARTLPRVLDTADPFLRVELKLLNNGQCGNFKAEATDWWKLVAQSRSSKVMDCTEW